MKILICAHVYLPNVNGVAHAVHFQYRMLKELGHEVHIVTSSDNASPDRMPAEVIRTFAIKGSGRLLDPFTGAIGDYVQFLADADYDLAFFHCWESWVTEVLVGRLGPTRFKKVVVSHGTSMYYRAPGLRGILRMAALLPYQVSFNKKMAYFDHFVLLSEASSKDRFYDKRYLDQHGCDNWTVIPNVATPVPDRSGAQSFRQYYGLPEGHIALCVSNFGAGKGQDVAVAAFVAANPKDHLLVLIGNDDNAFAHKLRSMAGALLNESIFLLTSVSRDYIALAYTESRFFLFCSQTEAQPLVLLDCLPAGLPFLSSAVGCVDSIAGGMVYRSRSGLKVLLRRFLTDDELLRRLASDGRSAYERTYTYAAVKARWSDLLPQLIQLRHSESRAE